ncbi:MAG: endonuclease domain-containing protein [Hyphomicrobiales bacterium]
MSAPSLTANARRLRRDATEAEKRLWRKLRELDHPTAHFRRQAPIGPYIVDFASHSLRLVIELDGGQHGWRREAARDAARDSWLRSQGYRVLRFWNVDVAGNAEGVMAEIISALEVSPPTPDPSPRGGGEMKSQALAACEPSPSMGEASSSPSPLMGEARGGGEAVTPGGRGDG